MSALRKPGREVWWRHAVAAGGACHATLTARRLARDPAGRDGQRRAWRQLVAGYAVTEFGRSHGIEAAVAYSQFQHAVPPRRYEDLVPWIERMKEGRPSVLWPGRCAHFAVSSGTTAGRTKYIPVTPEMIAHFRRTGLDSLCFYARRRGSSSVFRGRHLFLGGSTALTPLPTGGPFRAWSGDLSGITAMHLPRWVERHLYEPGREIAQMTDWPDKLRAMVSRTLGRHLTLLAGIPSWILVLAEEVRAQTGCRDLASVWPHLECLVHGGVPIDPFVAPLREALGPGVSFHEVYPASEAFIAAQDGDAAAGLRLLTGAGVFYEFLPMSEFDEARLGESGSKVMPLENVRTGVDYALVLSTPAGLCRYVIGDVVRFVSVQPPRLVYVGRTRLHLSAFGEHVIEKEVTDAVVEVANRHGVRLANFHVAPRFVDGASSGRRGRHEWWIETCGEVPLSGEVWAVELDAALRRANEDYDAKREGGGLDAPLVRVVPAGTFERWLRERGKWGGQNKMPRCRSDRAIADALAALSRSVSGETG